MKIPQFLIDFAEYQKTSYFGVLEIPGGVQQELEIRIDYWLYACEKHYITVQETVERINRPFDASENLALYE